MEETGKQDDPLREIKDRLAELNQKSYYLLVALSFLFVLSGRSNNGDWQHDLPIKVALTFTTFAAVIPLQDFVPKEINCLQLIRWFKVVVLILASAFTLYWLWTSF